MSALLTIDEPRESDGASRARTLATAGWCHRGLIDAGRLTEVVELYESLGFEVLREAPTPDPRTPDCAACQAAACTEGAIIYTRPRGR